MDDSIDIASTSGVAPRFQPARGVAGAVHDPARLAALRDTGLLDTDAEEVFDRLTAVAREVLGADKSLVSLVDCDRQFLATDGARAGPAGFPHGLPNATLFRHHLGWALERSVGRRCGVVVLSLGIDDFTSVTSPSGISSATRCCAAWPASCASPCRERHGDRYGSSRALDPRELRPRLTGGIHPGRRAQR